ncbi:WD40-repeat-containing domain protein [Stachybotrys elegans]|uniref:WD40-repeat-containing domain protein n=1 Tax=Stachybotrys elegans TaxID=80388 RepID=A0A8K0SSV5_9HYPO|nr:WD40-repeat-containing domain protein [Stachybotrys elegans]
MLNRPLRSPLRGRACHESRLSLKRVIGTTCCVPTGFDAVNSSFAYIAGGAVVVVDVNHNTYSQRFYRARPTAVPIYSSPGAAHHNSSTILTTPKANDSRNRVAPGFRDSQHSPIDSSDSPTSRTWTSRERIKAATCVALSRDSKFLAVGETGYAPRVLIFSLQDTSSDVPLVSISEHSFGVNCVAWSPDTKYLASLGAANDGFLYVWKVDPRTGAAKLFQQNRCTSYIRAMVWVGNNLITLGVRHVKMWKVEEPSAISPTRRKFLNDQASSQKTLPGRNIILGSLIDATFSCAAVDGKRLIIGTEAGDVCILDDEDDRQLKLLKVLNVGFGISSMAIRNNTAYVSGKDGELATLDVDGVMEGRETSLIVKTESSTGLVAMGFLTDKLVTIDSHQSIDVWNPDYLPGQQTDETTRIPIPGHGEPILGIQAIKTPNHVDADFLTWSGMGKVMFWDLEGRLKSSVEIPMEHPANDFDFEPLNQLTYARISHNAKLLVTADQLGVLRVLDMETKDFLLDTKAHSSHCLSISLYEEDGRFLMASCGRDRATQLFHRLSGGQIEHFQTLEFTSRVVQVLIPTEDKVLTCSLDRTLQIHEIMAKEGEQDVLAAIPSRTISLKASPTSMTMGPDNRTVFVSLLDRTVCQFEISSGRQVSCFKCMDEYGIESVVTDSLTLGSWPPKDIDFLLAASNTDKSIRLYDSSSGAFIDREWGHTEAIHGVTLLTDADNNRKVVSVGSDGTIMIWALDLNDPSPSSMSRDPSPVKDSTPAGRPTLRKVLSKAELAEFPRPQSSLAGRRSPPRTIRRRTSRFNLPANANTRTPTGSFLASPGGSTIADDTPSRRPSADVRASSPPPSPKGRLLRRPSLPALGGSLKKRSSSSSLAGHGSLNTATEQTCRTLRTYRKKLSSTEPISADALAELDQELRLTAAALGDRAIRSKAMNETVLSGLLDQYSERLITLLDEKLRLTPHGKAQEMDSASEGGSRSPDADMSSSSS